MKNDCRLHKILIHPDSLESAVTRRILDVFPDVPSETATDVPDLAPALSAGRDLFLAPFPGLFLKPCPCTPTYIGCDYYVMNLLTNCTLECTYCILQAYLDSATIRIFTNPEQLYVELDNLLSSCPDEILRIGTGELSDSLIFDDITGQSADLIHYFSRTSNAVLELKTKTANIDHLLNTDHRGRTVMAWSLNPPDLARREELYGAPISERLAAARRCLENGFPVAFHFDPIIHYPGWQDAYTRLVQELYRVIDRPGAIAWISLGSLRYMPRLKESALRRYPGTRIYFDDFIRGMDGKIRYFIDLRMEMYRSIVAEIRRHDPQAALYFCMESEDVWQSVLGWAPSSAEELRRFLTRRWS